MAVEETQPVRAATLALVTELLVKPTSARWETSPPSGAANARMLRHVRENLSDPTLGPDALCQRFGVSRAVLYRAFEPLGGVSAYIRSLRLRRAYELSCDLPPPLGRLAASLASQASIRSATPSVANTALRPAGRPRIRRPAPPSRISLT